MPHVYFRLPEDPVDPDISKHCGGVLFALQIQISDVGIERIFDTNEQLHI